MRLRLFTFVARKHLAAILGSSGVIYLTALLILAFIVNPNEAYRQKLNFLPESRHYPRDFALKQKPFEKAQFLFSLQYYRTVLALADYAKHKQKRDDFALTGQTQALTGFCFYYLGDHSRAITAYQKSLKTFPASYENHLNLGRIYFQKRNYLAAINELRHAEINYLALAKNPPTFHDGTANLYHDIALQSFPEYIKIRKLLVLSHFHLAQSREMLSIATRSILEQVDPQKSFFSYYAGIAAFQIKDYSLAATFLKQAIEKEPHFQPAYEFLSLCVDALGQKETAQDISREAMRLREQNVIVPAPTEGLLDLSVDPLTYLIPLLR